MLGATSLHEPLIVNFQNSVIGNLSVRYPTLTSIRNTTHRTNILIITVPVQSKTMTSETGRWEVQDGSSISERALMALLLIITSTDVKQHGDFKEFN